MCLLISWSTKMFFIFDLRLLENTEHGSRDSEVTSSGLKVYLS